MPFGCVLNAAFFVTGLFPLTLEQVQNIPLVWSIPVYSINLPTSDESTQLCSKSLDELNNFLKCAGFLKKTQESSEEERNLLLCSLLVDVGSQQLEESRISAWTRAVRSVQKLWAVSCFFSLFFFLFFGRNPGVPRHLNFGCGTEEVLLLTYIIDSATTDSQPAPEAIAIRTAPLPWFNQCGSVTWVYQWLFSIAFARVERWDKCNDASFLWGPVGEENEETPFEIWAAWK